MCKLYPNIRPYRKISFVTSIRNAIYRTKTMQIHKVESFTRKPCSAKQRHAREWKCYPSVCPKQPSGHQPTGLWSDRFQGKREVVRPGFSLHFWHVKKFESRYPMKWMDFFMAQLPMKNFWAIGKRRKCKDFVTETPSLTIAPHHWSQLHLQEPPAVYQNWYSFHLYFWLSLSFAWCCYHWFHCFPVPATWKTCIFCPHKTPPTAFQGATLLRLLNSTSGFPFRSLSMLHRRTPPKSGQGSILLDWLNLCKVPKMIKALRPKDTKWQL